MNPKLLDVEGTPEANPSTFRGREYSPDDCSQREHSPVATSRNLRLRWRSTPHVQKLLVGTTLTMGAPSVSTPNKIPQIVKARGEGVETLCNRDFFAGIVMGTAFAEIHLIILPFTVSLFQCYFSQC